MAFVRTLLAAAAVFAAAPVGAAPLEAYGKLPNIETVTVSPSGRQVAVVVTNGEERRLVVKDLAANKVTFLATVGNTKLRDLDWAGEQHLILTNSHTLPERVFAYQSETYFASDIDLAAKKLRPLMRNVGEDTLTAVAGLPIVRMVGDQPVVLLPGVRIVNSSGRLTLYRIDLERQTTRPVETGGAETSAFLIGPQAEVLAQTTYNGETGHWALKAKMPSGWREVLTRIELIERPSMMGLGRDGRSVLVALGEKDEFAWREVSLDTGASSADLGVEGSEVPIHDPATGRLIGTFALAGDQPRYSFYDPADAQVWRAVEGAFPGDGVRPVAWSQDRKTILVRVDSATAGPAYSVVDLANRKASWLGAEYETLKPEDISPVKALNFKAADGRALSGYLTLPRGRPAKGLPLIVFPHGGPAARDVPGFDWWAQAMASRGYAVLQVNFRGSDGFGLEHMKAGFGEWGRKMQSDVSDGVRYLAGEGTIDPKRVCIVGASYGGYAALAGVTLESGVYRCAVSFGGVSDLKRMLTYDRDRGGRSSVRYWTRFMGAQNLGDPVLATYSPALQAQQASAPILLIHGKDDTVVPLEQSSLMADALRRAGKPVELVVQNNADHWLSLGATRLQMLQSTMAFLEKHNPPN